MSLPAVVIPFVKASACGNDFLLVVRANVERSRPVGLRGCYATHV